MEDSHLVHKSVTAEEEKIKAEMQDLLRHVKEVLGTPSGEKVFKHLFCSFGVGDSPDPNLRKGDLIQEATFFATGNEILKLAMRASPKVAAKLLQIIQEERDKNV